MKKIVIIIFQVLFALTLSAQGINQSVEVTTDYRSQFSDAQRYSPKLVVPDSLYRFDYSFDYSVFDSPYKGSYDFTPYKIEVTPDPLNVELGKFYLKAGAGYTLHPVLDVVYSPVMNERSAITIYNTGKGYSANHSHDIYDELGLAGHRILRRSTLKYSLGYDGIFAGSSEMGSTSYHSIFAGVGLKSEPYRKFAYDIDLKYRYSSEKFSSSDHSDNYFSLSGFIGPYSGRKFAVNVDYSLQGSLYKSDFSVNTFDWSVTPHFDFIFRRGRIELGVKVDEFIAHEGSFRFAPHFKAETNVLRDHLHLFLGFTGGDKLATFHALKCLNHFYRFAGDAIDPMREVYNAFGGLSGHFGTHFQYELLGGYASYSGMPMDALSVDGLYAYEYVDYHLPYIQLSFNVLTSSFDLGARVRYESYDFDEGAICIEPAEFRGSVEMKYNWRQRIFVGLTADGQTKRAVRNHELMGGPLLERGDIKGFVDLGLYFEYRMTRSFGLWAKGGNLLGQHIERFPGAVEKSPYLTLGVTLNLKKN